jgi:hypothetical protein
MSNNPDNSKLSTSQFGGMTGPSDSELIEIEQGGEDSYYTPERIEDMRKGFSHLDANYSALRASRERTRGPGTTQFGITRAADKSSAAAAESEYLVGSAGTDGGKNTGGSSDFDAADTHGSYRASGFGGMDIAAGPRASSFDRNLPRTTNEAAARQQGLMFLQIAGPTCNHPVCSAYRAKGVELLGRSLGSDRRIDSEPGVAQEPWKAIPSVRKVNAFPQALVRPESADVPEGKRKGSFGTGEKKDMGDYALDYKNSMKIPVHEPQNPEDPEWVSMNKKYNKANTEKGGQRDLFAPSDYLEHHHDPEELNYKLPWE